MNIPKLVYSMHLLAACVEIVLRTHHFVHIRTFASVFVHVHIHTCVSMHNIII
jgi:hypothetical protein